MQIKSTSPYLLNFNSVNITKKCDIFSKIHKDVNWLRCGVFIIKFDQREINVKGNDNFTIKTTSMKKVEEKRSSLTKKCNKEEEKLKVYLFPHWYVGLVV